MQKRDYLNYIVGNAMDSLPDKWAQICVDKRFLVTSVRTENGQIAPVIDLTEDMGRLLINHPDLFISHSIYLGLIFDDPSLQTPFSRWYNC